MEAAEALPLANAVVNSLLTANYFPRPAAAALVAAAKEEVEARRAAGALEEPHRGQSSPHNEGSQWTCRPRAQETRYVPRTSGTSTSETFHSRYLVIA